MISSHVQRFVLLVTLLLCTAAGTPTLRAAGLTPKSPEVLAAVQRAVAFLEKEGARESRLGGKALISMALLKAGAPENHPMIQGTIKGIRASINTEKGVQISDHIYTAGLVVLFLGDLGPDRYRPELTAYARFLLENQRSDGAWTYLTSGKADNYPSGDMSMTQYAVMALWTLHQLDFDIPGERVNRVGRWLVSVQDSEGGYAYQTTVRGNFESVSWNGVRLSMSTAGMASVYVCRDLFGYNEARRPDEEEAVHDAFREVPREDGGFRSIGNFRFTVPKSTFDQVQQRGNRWLGRHFYPITTSTQYFFYYLYALERYGAFRELADTKILASPEWYDKTAEFLLEKQGADGSWSGNLGKPIDTAYAVLFLLRSTRRTFDRIGGPNRFGGASLQGGRGLPKLTDDVKIEDGRVVSMAEMASPEQLLERLARLGDTDDEALAELAELPADEVENFLRKNKSEIKKLVGHPKAERRLASVILLGKSGDVANAPPLIYALTDPDPEVARAAMDALHRVARLPMADDWPDGNDAASGQKRLEIIDRWKTWYRRIDPDVRFEER